MRRPLPFGKYLLLERINVGGMAEIFIAKAFGVEGFERILAIKRILPTMAEDAEFISMFIDEARISVQLNHANIVHIHELGRYGETYFIAMEYVSGRDLRAVLEYYQREQLIMPVAQAVYIASRMCDGLDHAHRKKDARGSDLNIVHRDVSPQNVLLSFDGEVKLIDFGIAKAAGRLQKTQAGILKGKFGYMSPEQVRGLELDHRSDIFAVGVVLYEMLTGQRLFTGESDFSVLERVRDAVVPPPRELNVGIPEGLETILLRALAGDREDRYQWASDLQEDLMRFLLSGDAIYGAKHLSGFLRSAFADELVVEAQRMERYASIDRAEELDPGQATTNYGPRPDLAAAAASDDGDLTPAPVHAGSIGAQNTSDRTMITEPPAPIAAGGTDGRIRTPARGQVVIGQGQQKYDGATVVGAVPALAELRANVPAPVLEDDGEKTFVGELPQRSAPVEDAGDKTFVGQVPVAASAPAPVHAGAIPEDDDDEQDTRMLEAAEFAAQGFDASSIPEAEGQSDDPDDRTDPAMRLSARPEPSWEDEAANASAAGWGLPDAPPAPKAAAVEAPPEETWDRSDDDERDPAQDDDDADDGQADDAEAAIAARAAAWGADPVTRMGPPSNPSEDDADDSEEDEDPYAAELRSRAAHHDDRDDADYGDSSDGYDDDGEATGENANGYGDAPRGYDDDENDAGGYDDDGYADGDAGDEDEDEDDPLTRQPDAPYDTGAADEEEEWEQTPPPAAAPVASRKAAAAAPAAAGASQKSQNLAAAFKANPKPFYIGGGVALFLLLATVMVALLGGGGPELVVHVDPASARLTINGQPANPGTVIASQSGVFLVRAEASGYLADEAEIELTADGGRKEITLRLGVAPPPAAEPPAEPTPVAEAAPADPNAGTGTEGQDEPARAFFLGEVAGAEVRLDGALVGTLPEFETGALVGGRTYTYAVSREGYQTETGEFTAVEGKVMEIEIALEPISKPVAAPTPPTQPAVASTGQPSTTTTASATAAEKPAVKKTPPPVVRTRPRTKMGKLAASSKPSGAAIYVDGKKMNRVTPVGLGSPLELPVGEHTIVFKLDNRESAPRKINVSEDGITKLANVPIP